MDTALDQFPLSWSLMVLLALVILGMVKVFKMITAETIPSLQVDLTEGDQENYSCTISPPLSCGLSSYLLL